MTPKFRADQLVHEKGLCESREKAKSLIMAGKVFWIDKNNKDIKVEKPGQQFSPAVQFKISPCSQYVSRGAYKLATLVEQFSIDITGKICLDAGASTGGFTDYLLQHGAARVYAVDVGTNQLHEKLRADPRVISFEQTNLRTAPANLIPEKIDFFTGDLSFISLTQILPNCMQWLKPNALIGVLIKPQFELSPAEVHKGVVKDPILQKKAIDKIEQFCVSALRLRHIGTVASAIKGPKGNQEYMAFFQNTPK